ncbi:MAG: 30S ribosomal protein S8 [Clostridia bacterium]|jgi:small subunit ribosomal protein S8|nr:30S ribosomal protein S8 [Clostridia bacterium]
MTDPIADMLTRIRNALTTKKETVEIPSSNMKKAIADILLSEGYVKDVKTEEDGYNGKLVLTLKYTENRQSVIGGLKRVSKPGLRTYSGAEKMPKVLGGFGIAIVSTNKGIMTDKQAKAQNVGGEVLCYIW